MGLAFGGAAVDVDAGTGAVASPGERDGVDGTVECAVASAVEPVADGLAAAGLDRVGATQRRERDLVAAPARAGEAHDGLRGTHRPDPPYQLLIVTAVEMSSPAMQTAQLRKI